jgi:four helix bundle protein
MEKENTVKFKSRQFAIDIINLYKSLVEDKKEFVLSKQVLRSGTSIGANVVEAEAGISKKDFLAKMYISFKECCETEFWLDIMHETEYIDDKTFNDLMPKCSELNKMLTAITKTTKTTKESFE